MRLPVPGSASFWRDRGERGAGAYADQNALLAGGAAGHLLGVGRIDLDDAVEQVDVQDGGDEAGADPLDRVRAGLRHRR